MPSPRPGVNIHVFHNSMLNDHLLIMYSLISIPSFLLANISAPKWKSVEVYLGELPKESKITKFALPSSIPGDQTITEILLYVEIINGNIQGSDKKMIYTLFTEENGAKYQKYLPARFSNAANIWLPYTSQRQIHVKATAFPRSLKNDASFSADIYVTGYRNRKV